MNSYNNRNNLRDIDLNNINNNYDNNMDYYDNYNNDYNSMTTRNSEILQKAGSNFFS
jgi:hypothetical protein